MKIWCAAEEEKRRYRPFWMLAGGFGLLLLCMLIAAGSAILALYSPYGAWVSLGGCVLAVAVGVALASRLGSWSAEGNTLFWLDDEDRLFALDTRDGAPDGRGFYALLAQEKAAARRMRKARQQLEAGQDPGGVELLAVLRVTLRRRGRTVRCSVRYSNGGTGEQSFFLPDRMDGAEELLNILDRKRRGEGPEVRTSRWPAVTAVSGFALAVFILLCVFSHPAVGRLPDGIYFPSLGGGFIAFCVLVYALLKHRRGE